MIVIVTGFIPLSLLFSLQWLCGKAASGLERIYIVQSTGLKNLRKAWIGALADII